MAAKKAFWEVVGCSWAGKTTKRNGKAVTCGHRHKTQSATKPCVAKMRKSKPGNCQDYRAVEVVYKKADRSDARKPNRKKKPAAVQDEVGHETYKAFDLTMIGDTTVKVVLERPKGHHPVTKMRIVGGSFKRVGTAIQRKTPGGPKALTLNILYEDAT
jgi:hypothetical protein